MRLVFLTPEDVTTQGQIFTSLPPLPDGYAFLVDDDGKYLIDSSGDYLIVLKA